MESRPRCLVPKEARYGRWAEAHLPNMHPMQVYAYPKITSERCSHCNEHYYDIEFFVPLRDETNKTVFALLHNQKKHGVGNKLTFSAAMSECCITPGCRNSHPLVANLQRHKTLKSFNRMMTDFHKGMRIMKNLMKKGVLGEVK